ncbi:outer membrane beta-barrel protein [Chryseobacterium sp. 22543]|uniref:outer membrane beta-barrel protein n=1 Tax=Chryseobacterium sp. 22543 TaxID=3453940 RepID=UPI003F8253D7
MKTLSTLLIAILWSVTAWPQQKAMLHGRVLDVDTHKPVQGATIGLILAQDSSKTPYIDFTTEMGDFHMMAETGRDYKIFVVALGYPRYLSSAVCKVTVEGTRWPEIYLKRKSIELSQVEIIESRSPVSLKKDTTEFSAGYYKTNATSPVTELLRKIPGVQITPEGAISVNGVAVKQIMIDGKPYFGNDLTKINNILAGAIEKIQLIDRKDPEEISTTGYQASQKAINLSLKKDLYSSVTGFVTAGYGTSGRFTGRTSLNKFEPHQQISFIAGADNITSFDQNIRLLNGNNQTTSWNGGLNYNLDINPKLSVSASYLLSGENTTIKTTSTRQNFLKDSSFNNEQSAFSKIKATVHTVDIRLKYTIDSVSSIAVLNRISYSIKDQDLDNGFLTASAQGMLINSGTVNNQNNQKPWYALTNWTYIRKFKRPGQILTTGFNYSRGSDPQMAYNNSLTNYHNVNGLAHKDSMYQLVHQHNNNGTFQFTINYAQPISPDRFLDVSYVYTWSGNKTQKNVFGARDPKESYNQLIDTLSGGYKSSVVSHYGNLSFRTQKQKMDYSFGIGIIQNQLFTHINPGPSELRRNLFNFFPTAVLNYQIAQYFRLHFDYSHNVQPPDPNALLPLPDNSNPLLIRQGNPGLKASSQDYFNISMTYFNPTTLLSLNLYASQGLLHNQIGQDISFDSTGKQISRPINVNGTRYTSLYLSTSLPIKPLKTAVNTSSSINLTRDIALTNGQAGIIHKRIFRQSLGFNYTRNDLFELMAQADATYTNMYYSYQSSRYGYFDYSFSVSGTLNLPLGFKIGAYLAYNKLSGRGQGYNTEMLILNSMLAKSFLKEERGQLKIQVFDLLNRNVNTIRSVGDTFIEDTQTTALKYFALLTLTYYLKKR